MARERDDEVDASSELEDLRAHGPEPLEPREPAAVAGMPAASGTDEDLAALAALAAPSKPRRADGDSPSRARVESGLASRSRGFLPLAIGIGVGVIATVLVSSLRHDPPAGTIAPPPSAAGAPRAGEQTAAPSVIAPAPSATNERESAANPQSDQTLPPPSAAAQRVRSADPQSDRNPPPPSAAGPHRIGSAPNPAPAGSPPIAAPNPKSSAAGPGVVRDHPPEANAPHPPPPSAAGPTKAEPAPDSEEARLAAASVRNANASDTPLDDVLDDAFSHGDAKASQRTAAKASAAMPVAPTREDVMKAMTVLVPAIRGCAQGHSGLATAAIVVRNDGKVDSVRVSGQPFEDSASGRCMEGVVRRARFPRFQQASFRVQFPFSIQ